MPSLYSKTINGVSGMIKADIEMKRDMDLVRAILLALEADTSGQGLKIEIPDYTQQQIDYHAELMAEAGLIEISVTETLKYKVIRVKRLTWAGHEFLDAARQNHIWNLAKDSINKVGGATIQIWIGVLTALIQKQLGL